MESAEAEQDWSPLIAVDHLHANRYGTIKLLEVLFSNFDRFFPNLDRNTQFQGRAYVEIMIVELACQYVEDVATYSIACKETGLLYMERVLSVTTTEIGNFYRGLDELMEEDIGRIFNIHQNQAFAFDYSRVRHRYRTLQQFRNQYQGFHNAIKHGWRFRISELSPKDKPITSMRGSYIAFQWIEVNQRRSQIEKVKTWDRFETQIRIRDRKQNIALLPCDNINTFVDIAQDSYTIIEDILKGHTPHFEDI